MNQDTLGDVADGASAGGVQPDVVALDDRGGRQQVELDTRQQVATDDVPLARSHAADGVARRVNEDAVVGVGYGCRAAAVQANEIALNQVAGGAPVERNATGVVSGDDVAAADRVVVGTADEDATVVRDRRGAARIYANVVVDDLASGGVRLYSNPRTAIPRDYVARRTGTADGRALRGHELDAGITVRNADETSGIGANQVALNQIAGASQLDRGLCIA